VACELNVDSLFARIIIDTDPFQSRALQIVATTKRVTTWCNLYRHTCCPLTAAGQLLIEVLRIKIGGAGRIRYVNPESATCACSRIESDKAEEASL
jgi:hypothetical protein